MNDESKTTEQTLEIAEESMLHDLMAVCLQEIKAAPDIWTRLGENEQDEIIHRVEKACRAAARNATNLIDSQGRQHALARVDYVKFKDGEAIAQLKGRADTNFHAIADADGPVLVIIGSDNLASGSHNHKAESDQKSLELESGDDFKISPPEEGAETDPGEIPDAGSEEEAPKAKPKRKRATKRKGKGDDPEAPVDA